MTNSKDKRKRPASDNNVDKSSVKKIKSDAIPPASSAGNTPSPPLVIKNKTETRNNVPSQDISDESSDSDESSFCGDDVYIPHPQSGLRMNIDPKGHCSWDMYEFYVFLNDCLNDAHCCETVEMDMDIEYFRSVFGGREMEGDGYSKTIHPDVYNENTPKVVAELEGYYAEMLFELDRDTVEGDMTDLLVRITFYPGKGKAKMRVSC